MNKLSAETRRAICHGLGPRELHLLSRASARPGWMREFSPEIRSGWVMLTDYSIKSNGNHAVVEYRYEGYSRPMFVGAWFIDYESAACMVMLKYYNTHLKKSDNDYAKILNYLIYNDMCFELVEYIGEAASNLSECQIRTESLLGTVCLHEGWEMLEFLFKHGLVGPRNLFDYFGYGRSFAPETPVELFRRYGSYDVIEMLHKKGYISTGDVREILGEEGQALKYLVGLL